MSKLREAAIAVLDRWDSPLWKDLPHTARYMHDLRTALDEPDIKTLQAEGKGPAPCARFCEATAFRIEIAGWKRDQAENLKNQCELAGQLQRALIERDEWKTRLEFSFEQRDKLTAERDEYAKCADALVVRAHIQAGVIQAAREVNQRLLKERDEYAKAADDMAASHKVERDELSRLYENALKREYALMAAAKLALDALEQLHSIDTETESVTIWVEDEIEALKKAGVKC